MEELELKLRPKVWPQNDLVCGFTLCLTDLLRHREAQIEALTRYIRDPYGASNHDNDDAMAELDTDQLIAIVDQQQRWQNNVSAGNCSHRRLKRRRGEAGQFDVDFDVLANWKRNLTKADDIRSRDECPEITFPKKAGVTEKHHQVSFALHLASTVLLGLLVLEVSIIIYVPINCILKV